MPAAKPTPGSFRACDILQLGELLGSTWDGYCLIGTSSGQGELVHPYWRRPFTAGDLNAMFYQTQRVGVVEYELSQLKKEVERATEAQFDAERQANWYRRQLVLESRMGAFLLSLSQ